MKGNVKAFVAGIVFVQVLFLAGSPVSAGQFQHGVQHVIGVWQCVSINGTQVRLDIDTEKFTLNGEGTPYSMVIGAIRVEGAYGPVNYYYNFRGDSLVIAFPDGERILCDRGQMLAKNYSLPAGDLPALVLPDDENSSR